MSAVLFTSSGTISKFNRMGRLAGFGRDDQSIIRMGVRHNHDPDAVLPTAFLDEIKQGVVRKNWTDGLSMFHNPNAKHPVEPAMFRGIAHHFYRDGQIESFLSEFHAYSSYTWNFVPNEDDGNGNARAD